MKNSTQHVSEIEVSYRPSQLPTRKIQSSKDAYYFLNQIWNQDTICLREEFVVLYLNRANKLIHWFHLSKGSVSGTVADPKMIFSTALKTPTSNIILAHNHPSGNLQPSQADINLTKKVKSAGLLFDIQVLDHIILTSESYYSMADEGGI